MEHTLQIAPCRRVGVCSLRKWTLLPSQDCEVALHVLLGFGGHAAMAAFIGMSGWLPFAETLELTLTDREVGDDDDDNTFGSDSDAEDGTEHKDGEDVGMCRVLLHELQRAAVNTARDIASLPSLSAAQGVVFPSTHVFSGHGRNDEKVSVNLGKQAKYVLEALGCEDYEEGHWYEVPEEFDDAVEFLQGIVNIED